MKTIFKQLNEGWNAEPNAPCPRIGIDGSTVNLTFFTNSFQFPAYNEGDLLRLEFLQCWRYRLGPTNDEGWSMGQYRFGRLIPWGEFYELLGELLIDKASDWISVGTPDSTSRHFLLYFRDETFECDATFWRLTKIEQQFE